MQVLFPKHVWRHTECMPTSHWRTGASHISLRVITVAWWISSKQITDPLPTSLSYCCYCCYLFCSAAATTVATAVTCLALLLLLLLLLSLATVATCYCCHYCCSLPLLLLVTLLLRATILVRSTLTGKNISHPRATSGAIDTTVTNSLPSIDRFLHRCYHTTLLLTLCLQILIFQMWLNLTHSAANTWVYPLTSFWRINKFGSNTLPSKTAAIPRAGGPSTTFF